MTVLFNKSLPLAGYFLFKLVADFISLVVAIQVLYYI